MMNLATLRQEQGDIQEAQRLCASHNCPPAFRCFQRLCACLWPEHASLLARAFLCVPMLAWPERFSLSSLSGEFELVDSLWWWQTKRWWKAKR